MADLSRPRIAVIGAGGVGGFFAAQASCPGHDVTLCSRTPFERLIIETDGRQDIADVRIALDPAVVTPADWVFVATKAQDTASAEPWLRAVCDSRTTIVILQNGIDQEDRVNCLVDAAAILPSIVYCSVERVAPGHILHHAANRLVVPKGSNGDRLAALFSGSGIEIVQAEDFLTEQWRKLLANVAANPITALTMRRIGVLRSPDIKELARLLLSETASVAQAAGAHISLEDAVKILEWQCTVPPDSGTSMLYDRLGGRPLEHEFITGAVVQSAERHGVQVPFNRAVFALLEALSGAPKSESDAATA